MSEKQTGGSAFPVSEVNSNGETIIYPSEGMTLRQYAAIKLRVPDSGDDWLDELIRTALRDEFAAKAMNAYIATNPADHITESHIATFAYSQADAMLKAREA